MKSIRLILLIVSMSYCFANASDTIPANDPLIEYTGRIDFSDPLAPKFSYSGVTIRASFQGTNIAILLNDEDTLNYYNIILDNVLIDRLKVSKGLKLYPLASNLRDTIHEIEVFRLTELTFGKTTFRGFIVDEGKSLVAIENQRTHLIEYIGNSITCGYGNEGVNGGTFGPTTENHYLSYAAFTSRNFNARHLAVCRSGIGIYRNYGDVDTGSTDCMSNNYNRIFLYDKNPLYNFNLKPDLICVNLGTNDFSTNQGDSARFVNRYFSFLDTLQTKSPGTDILLLLGPMIGDPDLSKLRNYLELIDDSINKKGTGDIYVFEMSHQTGDLGIAIDYHPTVAQHLRNSLELTKYVSQLKGWKISPFAVKASVARVNEVVVSFNTDIIDTLQSYSGIRVSADTITLEITDAFIDTTDHSILHLILSDSIAVNQNISLDYIPGSIISADTIQLGKISGLAVENNLTATNVTKAYIDRTGTILFITFNKAIEKPENLNDIRIFDNKGNLVQIDSFSCSSKNMLIYIQSVIHNTDTIYFTLPGIIAGKDGVTVTPLNNFLVLNNSKIVSFYTDEMPEGILIYPNPAYNHIIKYSISEVVSTEIIVELFDIQGKLIFKQKLETTEGILDFNHIPGSKVYILKVSFSGKAYQKKILL